MRATAVLLAVCLSGCFRDAPTGDGLTDGGSSTESTGSTDGSATATSSQGSSSTPMDSEGSSSTDTLPETSTGVQAECGNAVVEPGEPCDDANIDELDGCLVDCRLGPIGLTVVEDDAPRPVGQEGLVVQSDSCLGGGEDRALEGLVGGLGGPGRGDTWPTSLGGSCLQLVLAQQDASIAIVASPSDPDLPVHGNPNGSQGMWALSCPAGTVPIGVRGRVYADTVPYIKTIALECATASVVIDDGPPHVVLSDAVTTAFTPGNESGSFGDSICGEGLVALGFRGRITDLPAVQDLGPRCGRIELVFPR